MNAYEETLKFLYDQLPMYQRLGAKAYKKDLTNTHALLEFLGNPHRSLKTVHVAGTNGKGTSCVILQEILTQAGYKTGLYTSPHLKDFRERMVIDGALIPESSVIDFVDLIEPAIAAIKPSFFEITVAMALWYFKKQQVDIAVIETGLGGRLDSTNVLTPEVSLITQIGYDHMDILGDTLEEIAQEKAGIIKTGVPAVIGADQPSLLHVFRTQAQARKAELIAERGSYRLSMKQSLNSEVVVDVFFKERLVYSDLTIGSLADYILDNVPGVLTGIKVLISKGWKIAEEHIRAGLKSFRVKGRMQILSRSPLIVADISHNQPGLVSLLKQLLNQPHEQLHFVLGFVNDKKVEELLTLFPENAKYYFTQSKVPRALSRYELKDLAEKRGLRGQIEKDVNQAIQSAKSRAGKDDLIVICGSTFVVAEINEL